MVSRTVTASDPRRGLGGEGLPGDGDGDGPQRSQDVDDALDGDTGPVADSLVRRRPRRHHDGSAAIGAGHRGIFDSIYRGSSVGYTVQTARYLDDDLVEARGHSTLGVPARPMAVSHRAINTTVLRGTGDTWAAVAFHNTLVRP